MGSNVPTHTRTFHKTREKPTGIPLPMQFTSLPVNWIFNREVLVGSGHWTLRQVNKSTSESHTTP
jgi:hypothetical protein